MEDREREEQLEKEKEQEPAKPAMDLFGEVTTEVPGDWEPRGPEPETYAEEVTREVNPTVRASARDRVDQRIEREENAPGLLEGFNRARDAEWIHRLALQDRRFAPDPDYVQKPERLMELADGLPEDAIDYIGQAESKEEEEFLAKRYREDYKNDSALAEMGWTGTGLQVAAAITDPTPWGAGYAASALTGPGGLIGTAANRLNRAQRIIRAGAVGAAGNASIEAAIAANKPIYDEMNILYAAGLGFGLSGGLSAISRNPGLSRQAQTFKEGGNKMMRDAEQGVQRATEDAVTASGDAGAARLSREEPISPEHVDIDQYIDDTTKFEYMAPETAMGTVGGLISSTSRLKSSKNPASRGLGANIAEDATGNKNRDIAQNTPASQNQLKVQRQNEMRWGQAWGRNLRKFREETKGSSGWKIWEKPRMEREFSELVSDYVEGIRTDVPASVRDQGETLRAIFEDYRVNLNQPGAYRGEYMRAPEGWGTKESDPYYLPHEFDYEGFARLVREFGTPNVEELFTRAIRNASDDITEEAARKAARAYVKTVRSLRVGLGGDAGRILGSGDAEEIKRFLRDQSEMADHEVEDAVDALTARKTSKGSGSKHSKARTPLDMSTTMSLRYNPENMPQGGRDVSIREFFNRDAHELFTQYNRRMSGELAMARMKVPGLADGITSNAEWETFKKRMREIGERVGQSPKEIQDDIAQADYLWKAVKGIPQDGTMGRGAQFLRRVRDWNFMRVMGQVGFAQLPEIAVAATGMGLTAALKSVPGFRTMWRNMETGRIDNELVDELEMMTGFGGDWLRMQHINRFDNPSNSLDMSMGGRFEQGYETFAREGKRAVFAGSGMGAVNTFSQRFAMTGIANKFAQMAGGGKRLSTQRLRAMGLTDGKLESVLDNIRRHAEFEDGLAGKKLKKLNIKDWDLATAVDFEDALYSYSRRLIQENDPGQFRPFMSNPIAQTILQFRTFIMGAHTKALLHNIHMRDFQTFSMFMSSSMMGAMGYMAYTYANAQGRSDKDDYLKERLSMDNVAKAAFERSSWAALVPTAIDTAAMPVSDPIFDFRTTGQSTDIIFGNPSTDLFDSAGSTIGMFAKPLTEGRMPAQEEIQAGLRTMPFQNLHGVTQMINLTLGASGLPERAPRD